MERHPPPPLVEPAPPALPIGAEVNPETANAPPPIPTRAQPASTLGQPQKKRARKKSAPERKTRVARPPRHHKAKAIKLKASATIDEAVAAIFTSCRDHWTANIPAAQRTADVNALYQMRVGVRRFRTALSFFKQFIPKSQSDAFGSGARFMNATLGPIRDLDVVILNLNEMQRGDPGNASATKALLLQASQERRRARKALKLMLSSAKYKSFVKRLESWLEERKLSTRRDGTTRHAAMAYAIDKLNIQIQEIQRKTKKVKGASARDLHDLRIVVKKTRYSMEFFASILPKKQGTLIEKELRVLQESFGRLTDRDMIKRTTKALAASAKSKARRDAIQRGRQAVKSSPRATFADILLAADRAGKRLRKLDLL